MTTAAEYVDSNGRGPEPRKPSLTILCQTPERHRHQEHWPEVEATTTVTIVKTETWGTDSATYLIRAIRVVDIRDGYTANAFGAAQRTALQACEVMANQIRTDNPHPRRSN